MTELEKLAARVEAEGLSRELDDEIATLLFTGKHCVCIAGLSDEAGGMWMFHYPDGSVGSSLRFTASLDAALTLVPEGWAFAVSSNLVGPGCVAGLMRSEPYATSGATAPTPAAALCAAALRANQESRND